MKIRVGETEPGPRATLSILAIILLTSAISLAFISSVKPFWFDEIYTTIISKLPGPIDVWNALAQAVDGNPPVYYFVNQLSYRLIPNEELAIRLPCLLGVLLAIICVYAFLRRRVSDMSALVGAVFVLTTQAAYYATEARPYGMLLGCVAASILAWQLVEDSSWYCVALALALAASITTHYYAILIWPAFVLAEMAVLWFDRRFRPGVWAALVVGLTPLLLLAPLLLNVRGHYGANIWARPIITNVLTGPAFLFNLNGFWGIAFTIALTAMFAAFACRAKLKRNPSPETAPEPNSFSAGDCALALTLLWLPAYSVVAARIGQGALTERYMMPAILGAALIVGYLAGKIGVRWKILALLLFCGHFGLAQLTTIKDLRASQHNKPLAVAARIAAIASGLHEDKLPIVISNGVQYIPIAYYTRGQSSHKFHALVDPPVAVEYASSDSVDLGLIAIKPYLPVNVFDFKTFKTEHREFLLVCENGSRFDWWSKRLLRDGHALQLLAQPGVIRVFKVTLKP